MNEDEIKNNETVKGKEQQSPVKKKGIESLNSSLNKSLKILMKNSINKKSALLEEVIEKNDSLEELKEK